MSSIKLERQRDLEASDAVRAFRLAGSASIASVREALSAGRGEMVSEGPYEFLVLDLREQEMPCPSAAQLLGELAHEGQAEGWRLICLVDGPAACCEANGSFATVPDPAALYDWLATHGVKKHPSSAIPLFSMTTEEVTALRAHGVSLGDLIRDLEQDSA